MDDTLVTALAADLDAAFPRLVQEHQDRLYSIAVRLLRDPRDAEEVAQDAMVRAYRAIASYEPERIRALQLRPWLATVVVNLSRNRVRRRVVPTASLEPLDGTGDPDRDPRLIVLDRDASPHHAAADREATAVWAGLLAQLPDRLRAPVVLRHVDGLSYAEMSTVLGRPEGTLKAQVHRGLQQLRAAAERAAVLDSEVMTA